MRAAGSVAVRLDYGSFADEYGGGWASRLRLVELPACALTTPGLARCRTQTPLTGTNEAASQELTATVPVAASGGTVVAAASTAAGAEGNYAATSLKPSGTWVMQDGDFHYSYPVTVPSSVGGSAPDVALSYDSQSIDGETSGTGDTVVMDRGRMGLLAGVHRAVLRALLARRRLRRRGRSGADTTPPFR